MSTPERAALDHDYRYDPDPLVRRRSHIVLLASDLETQGEVARVVRCSPDTVRRTLALYRQGGRSRLRRTPALAWHAAKRTLAWQKEQATAVEQAPEACGVPRPTWTAPLLAQHLAARTGIAVSEQTVRRGLDSLGFVCRRPVWTVRHKAEEQPDYLPKRPGSKRC
ncbi:MAG: helix-turn-helix domain-containing protein [Acidimicrobiales bacterium]